MAKIMIVSQCVEYRITDTKAVAVAGQVQRDSDVLQANLVSVGHKYTSDGNLLLEKKEDMRKRGVPSTDEADAVALCFSEPDGSASQQQELGS
jgi:hypothetical protein